jgi:hypothetical protein
MNVQLFLNCPAHSRDETFHISQYGRSTIHAKTYKPSMNVTGIQNRASKRRIYVVVLCLMRDACFTGTNCFDLMNEKNIS